MSNDNFFYSTVTGDSFLTLLEELILPEIRFISGNEEIIFLLDGTSLKYSTQVRNFSNNNLLKI